MFLWRLFSTNPLMAGALGVCLATIFWCIAILRRRQKGPDRFLAVLIGAICVTQGLRLLQRAGVISMTGPYALDSFAELMITGLYLIAILILRISAMERKSTEVRLRLVEADDQPRVGPSVSRDQPDQSISDMILGSNPLPTIGLDKSGAVIYWNTAAERLLGWKGGDVLGKPSPSSLSSPIRMKSGAQVRVESWVSDILDSSGRPCGTLHILAPLGTPQAASVFACDAPVLAC